MEEHPVPVHKWRLLPDFFSVFSLGGVYFPISCYLVPGFTPPTARFVHNNIISNEFCWVFVLWCQPASHLTCPVSFHRVHLSYTILRSYKLYISTVIQSYSRTSCTFIRSYIHTLMYPYIGTLTTYTQHHSYMIALVTQSLVWPYFFSSVVTLRFPKKSQFNR